MKPNESPVTSEYQSRQAALENAGYNTRRLPSAVVRLDLQTDSLMHAPQTDAIEPVSAPISIEAAAESAALFTKYFGFPYVIPVAQGRLAEALLARVMVRPHHLVPSSCLFATTRAHQLARGARTLELPQASALDPVSNEPFKGDLDIDALRSTIVTTDPKQIPYIYLEPCTDALGGQPISMANMLAIRAIADEFGLPVFLDACRVIDNAIQIQEFEDGYANQSTIDILHKFCGLADGLTMSASKNFVTNIGGCVATRDHKLFERLQDEALLVGDGLSLTSHVQLISAMNDSDEVFAKVRRRQHLVRELHAGLSPYVPTLNPAGAHAVYVNLSQQSSASDFGIQHPQERFLADLYVHTGIRGAPHAGCSGLTQRGATLLRFALPIVGLSRNSVLQAAQAIRTVYLQPSDLIDLTLQTNASNISGMLRAQFRPRFANHTSNVRSHASISSESLAEAPSIAST